MAININAVTTREKAIKMVEKLSEPQLGPLIDYLESLDRPGDVVDEWGNLSAMSRASASRSMRHLDEEERAAGHDPW